MTILARLRVTHGAPILLAPELWGELQAGDVVVLAGDHGEILRGEIIRDRDTGRPRVRTDFVLDRETTHVTIRRPSGSRDSAPSESAADAEPATLGARTRELVAS